ncbi:coatomer subunit epsilon [Lepeophtheirus salmonis]|uniref:Coatomer subunit epsilon n=2 Tax=Lepeophtheirus salmonis TaxID=72036 RepID=C1BTM0_LEPSM|nr:coatomer subunit epsilon-like [Lepeophtheirus salmonis]ACO12373.1 Coatomer subunit epsilon [Lepeophtheirus salmonis]ADD38755.1 Coatomer subunit epsilon [Lepeophtheirus salmonis]
MSEVDELVDVKNAFYIGNFANTVKEAQKLKVSDPDVSVEKDAFMYRGYIAMRKFGVIRNEIDEDSHQNLRPLLTLSKYSENKNSCKEEILSEVEKSNIEGPISALVSASIYTHEGLYENALRVLHSYSGNDNLEIAALKLQILLKMDRLDLAKKELKVIQDIDDDATLTQLAQAWVNMAIGGEKIQEAYYIYQELIEKFGSTPILLNGQAASFLAQEKFEEAEAALQEALDKDSDNPDTLINLMVLSQQTGKPIEVYNRYMTQLKDHDPHHSFIKDCHDRENDFNRLMAQYAI